MFSNESDEARAALKLIEEFRSEYRLSDIAVCYRANSQSRALEAACAEAALPYRVMGGPKFLPAGRDKGRGRVSPADSQSA